MSAAEQQATPEQHSEPNGEPRLDPNSYTAHRLHHGTPDHLHLTTRRVFVGPIPIGWLKNHRSEWFKQHLHIYYSTAQAAFNSPESVSRKRKLSGLEHRNTDSWWTEGESSAPLQGEAAESSGPLPIPQASSSPDDAMPDAPRRKGKEPVEQSPTSQQTRRRPLTAHSRQDRTPGTNRGESFATAHESWDFTDEEESEAGQKGKNRALSSESTDDEDEEEDEEEEEEEEVEEEDLIEFLDYEHSLAHEEPKPMLGYASETYPSTASTGLSNEATNSLQSLLKHHDEARKKPPKRSKSSPVGLALEASNSERTPPILSLARKSNTTQPIIKSDSSTPPTKPDRVSRTNKERIPRGLVRFNTAVDRRERDKEMQRKLAELTRNRSLRRGGRHHPHVREREGEIVKMEKMLVRVEVATAQLPDDYDENESMKIDTRTVEKWREFVVVCRKSMDETIPMTLRLYKSRVIPAIDRPHVSTHSTRVIALNPKTTKVNLYSSLDKTLVIWLPYKRGTIIYIMRPRCSSSSVEWYHFLLKNLGWSRPETLQISVPDLSLTLRIYNPFGGFEGKLEREEFDGYDAVTREEQAAAKSLVDKSLNMLEGVEEWADILEYWKKSERIGLAWRRYDRLEWLHGVHEQRMYGSMAMQKTHDLELRPKIHYPTETQLEDGKKMVEPPPVEGFLIRLTTGKGRQERLGRMFYKRLYFTTHDNYLCFCKPACALPPPPPRLHVHGDVPPTSQIVDEIPLIYAVAPYAPNKDGDIEWLAKGTRQDIDCRDKDAYDEAERKVNTLLRADGFIDLCRVTEVRLMKRQPYGVDTKLGHGPSVDFLRSPPDPDSNAEDGRTGDINDERSFELVLDNGLVLRLQSFDKRTRDEWILRLKDLVVYWKARDRDDLAIIRRTRKSNLNMLHVDEEMESIIGQFARKWEVSRTVASGELYNICGISSCRTITMSGVLYRKPRKHATFRRYNVVLCHGELIIFHNAYRKRNGAEIPHIHQEKHQSLSLRDCYIYSGLITAGELLYQNQTFDSNAPGRHVLPRVYHDGLTSYDEDTMTCFVLWHGMRRSLFKTKDEEGRTIRHKVTQLGQPGKSIVFKARSRLERDTWVMSIGMEIERLNAGVVEEVKVTNKIKGVFS